MTLVAMELAKYNIDIAALCETRYSEYGSLNDFEYSFFCSGTQEEDIMVDGYKLNSVLEFTYIGSTISSNGWIDDEIQRRMAKASASYGRLRQRVWNNHHVSMRVKGKIYRAIVLSTLLYGAEAWTVFRRQVKKLHDVASAFDHEDNLDGQSNKQGHTRMDRAANLGRSSGQKESPVDWIPHEDITRQATKAGYLSILNCRLVTEREGALVSCSRTPSRET